MKKENIALSLSVTAISLNFIIICILLPRTKELSFDYLGVLIGMLSLLVCILALLFGYNILEFKKIVRREINNKLEDFEHRSTQAIVDIQYTSLQHQARIFKKAGDSGGFFINMANALYFSSLVKDINKIEACIEMINNGLDFKESKEGETFNSCGEIISLEELKNALLKCVGYNENAKELLYRVYQFQEKCKK